MKTHTIEFVEHRSLTEWVPMLDAYKLKPSARWFQRLAWRYLVRSGALVDVYEPKETVTRHLIDADKFIDRLLKQKRSLFDAFHKEGQQLLIGSEDYAELMNSPEITPHHFAFSAEFPYGRKIVGLKVEVIPWMRGMVVMP